MTNDKNIWGHAAMFTANLMWGLNAPIGKAVLAEFTPMSVTTFRMVGAAVAFWVLSFFCKKENVENKDLLKLFFAALFGVVFNQGAFIFGLSLTSPIDASIVTTTSPIVTMIVAAIYLKEPITNKKVLGIFIGALGSAHTDSEWSGRCQRSSRQHVGRPVLHDCTVQFRHLPYRI